MGFDQSLKTNSPLGEFISYRNSLHTWRAVNTALQGSSYEEHSLVLGRRRCIDERLWW
jgi:hypothetical protein